MSSHEDQLLLARQEIERLRAENERLRTKNAEAKEKFMSLTEYVFQLEGGVQQLGSGLEQSRNYYNEIEETRTLASQNFEYCKQLLREGKDDGISSSDTDVQLTRASSYLERVLHYVSEQDSRIDNILNMQALLIKKLRGTKSLMTETSKIVSGNALPVIQKLKNQNLKLERLRKATNHRAHQLAQEKQRFLQQICAHETTIETLQRQTMSHTAAVQRRSNRFVPRTFRQNSQPRTLQ